MQDFVRWQDKPFPLQDLAEMFKVAQEARLQDPWNLTKILQDHYFLETIHHPKSISHSWNIVGWANPLCFMNVNLTWMNEGKKQRRNVSEYSKNPQVRTYIFPG